MTPETQAPALTRALESALPVTRWSVALCLSVLLFCGPVAAQQSSSAAEAAFARVSPSVVVIIVKDASGKPALQGSGVVIASGHLITNCHVAQGGPRIEIRSSGKKFLAHIEYADPGRDLCELSVPGLAAPPIPVASVKDLKVGQRVFAIGAPEGLELTISDGIVSSLRPVGSSFLIQTTAPISPGSSGGGLFDSHSRLVGVTSYQFAKGQNLNFALPADWIAALPSRSRSQSAAAISAFREQLSFIASAAALEQKKDWQALSQLSLQRTRSYPDDEAAWTGLGEAYGELRQYDKAVAADKQAIQLKPDDEDAWYDLGVACGELGQYDMAVAAAKQAIQLKPDDEDAWVNLGVGYGELGQNDKEVATEKQAIQLKPDSEDAWVNLGAHYADLGQYDKALAADKQAIQLKPDDAHAWVNLGAHYISIEEFDKAVAAEKEAIQLKPRSARAWLGLGLAYCGQGDRNSAIGAYQILQKLNPEGAKKLFNACIVP